MGSAWFEFGALPDIPPAAAHRMNRYGLGHQDPSMYLTNEMEVRYMIGEGCLARAWYELSVKTAGFIHVIA